MRNLKHGPDPAQRFDLYRGPEISTVRPVLVHLHGGGFVSGSKSRESIAMLHYVAVRGWLCLSADCEPTGNTRTPLSTPRD